jgi:S1-C subfamily serine protease
MFVHAMFNCVSVIALVAAMTASAKAPVLGVEAARNTRGRAVVEKVVPRTGAEKVDLRRGDVILSYNNVAVHDFQHLISLVRAGRVGDTVRIEILRGGTRLEKQVILGPRHEASGHAPAPPR